MRRKIRRRGPLTSWLLSVFLLLAFALPVLAADNQIEQVYVNKPEVTVYYRLEGSAGDVRAYLGGEELTLEGSQLFSETGEAINYFVLTDISGSINDQRFEDIKQSLISFRQEMRQEDRMLLYTFGDQVTPVLSGEEDGETAAGKIAELANQDLNTLLFDAVGQAADVIAASEDEEQKKWVLIIISDGEDYADNTKTAQSTTERLVNLGIPAYTIAVENDMGYSEQVVSQYQGNFSAVASQTGGIAWTPGREDTLSRSVREALDQIQNSVLEGYRADFHSADNRISNQKEQFILEFPDKTTSVREVLVNRNQPDTQPPTVQIRESGENSFQVVYSEPVEGGDTLSNYLVSLDGKSLAVEQVVRDESGDNAYLLILKEELKNTVYHVSISNVTDASNESNPLTGNEQDVQVTGGRDVDSEPPTVEQVVQSGTDGFLVTFSESVENGENTGNYVVKRGEETVAVQQAVPDASADYTYRLLLADELKNGEYTIQIGGTITDSSPEANPLEEAERTVTVEDMNMTWRDVLELVLRWWPVALTVVVLILLVIVLLFNRRIRKKNVVVVDDQMIELDKVQKVVHVSGVNGKKSGPGKQIAIWLSNGSEAPRRIDYALEGNCIVGRAKDLCAIYCDDPMMSKQHFNLSVENDGNVYVTDLNSTNGTAVNGVRIRETRKLKSGDEITAGSIRFVIQW